MDRRKLLLASASLAAASLPTWAETKPPQNNQTSQTALGSSSTNKARVIVIGGGMAGATVAKYLRLWGNAIEVILVERTSTYTSCIMSSLVLTGQRTMSSLEFSYSTLRNKYGVQIVLGDVVAVDPVTAKVTLASGQVLTADRIVMAPGIEFDAVPGLTDISTMPHAWKAGSQTLLLARQLAAMSPAGQVVITIPKVPYRCPPGPYERACLLADWIQQRKPQGKLIVLDANPEFVTEKDNFSRAFFDLYRNVIEYRNNVVIEGVHQASKTLFTNAGAIRGDVVNLIPSQRAGALITASGLANANNGRFAGVNVLDYSSNIAPKVHIIGDSSATTQPKAGHIANQEAKVCADALVRIFGGGSPDPAPVTNSACFSTITMSKASWLHAMFQYDSATSTMQAVANASGASEGWDGKSFEEMGIWYRSLMADTFA